MLRRIFCLLLAALMLCGGMPIVPAFAQGNTPAASPDAEFDRHVQEARAAFGKKNYKVAAESFKKAYKIKPKSDILYNLGRTYEMAKDPKNAEDYFKKYVKSKDAKKKAKKDAFERMATIHFAAKDYPGAQRHFQDAYLTDPTPNTMYNIGRTLEKQQKLKEALTAFEKIYKDPDLPPKTREDTINRIKVIRETLKLDAKPIDEKKPIKKPVKKPPPEPDYTASIVLMSVGGALVITGAAFGGMTASEFDTFETTTDAAERSEAADNGALYGALADSFMIGGGVVAAIGVGVLIYQMTNAPEAENEKTVEFYPQIGPDEVAPGMSIRF